MEPQPANRRIPKRKALPRSRRTHDQRRNPREARSTAVISPSPSHTPPNRRLFPTMEFPTHQNLGSPVRPPPYRLGDSTGVSAASFRLQSITTLLPQTSSSQGTRSPVQEARLILANESARRCEAVSHHRRHQLMAAARDTEIQEAQQTDTTLAQTMETQDLNEDFEWQEYVSEGGYDQESSKSPREHTGEARRVSSAPAGQQLARSMVAATKTKGDESEDEEETPRPRRK